MFQQKNGGICPAEGTNPATDSGIATVDPSYQDCADPNGDFDFSDEIKRITPLQPCKNNCKGGKNDTKSSKHKI